MNLSGQRLSYLNLQTTDPSWNLAMEQYVFDSLPRDRMYFMLWQNDNAIIIGRHQNTLAEINIPYVQSHNIQVVRRLSGGGAVYHDMGNLNFTFICDVGSQESMDIHLYCQPIVELLREFNIPAQVSGRNDITVDGRKFSGNSQYLKKGRVMHHGTILFDSDLSVVNAALQVDPEKIRSKGVKSVRSHVTNLRPYLPAETTLETFRQKLLEHILALHPGNPYPLSSDDLAAVRCLQSERYATWEWNYGISPECTLTKRKRIEGCGTVAAHLLIENGLVAQVLFQGDFFSAEGPEHLANMLIGCRPTKEEYSQRLQGIDISQYIYGLTAGQLLELLTQ